MATARRGVHDSHGSRRFECSVPEGTFEVGWFSGMSTTAGESIGLGYWEAYFLLLSLRSWSWFLQEPVLLVCRKPWWTGFRLIAQGLFKKRLLYAGFQSFVHELGTRSPAPCCRSVFLAGLKVTVGRNWRLSRYRIEFLVIWYTIESWRKPDFSLERPAWRSSKPAKSTLLQSLVLCPKFKAILTSFNSCRVSTRFDSRYLILGLLGIRLEVFPSPSSIRNIPL